MTRSYYASFLALAILVAPNVILADTAKQVEDAHAKCLNGSNGENAQLSQCAGDRLTQLQDASRTVWHALVQKYSPHKEDSSMEAERKKSALLHAHKEQKAWEAYEKLACANLSDRLAYGTAGETIFFPDCRARVIQQRIQIMQEELCAGESAEDCK